MARHTGMVSANPLVIVVDDDAAVRNSLKFSLEIDGFAVRTYGGAEELIGADDLSDCRCLIIDQDMPRMTGLELVEALRKKGAEVPAILVSGNVTRALITLASGAGLPVVEKPVVGNGLIELIRATIDIKRS
jgi:two-component system, LuxR family, response regulator FixJ